LIQNLERANLRLSKAEAKQLLKALDSTPQCHNKLAKAFRRVKQQEKINQKNMILEVIRRHKKEIKSRFDIEKIGLFGSYAEEKASENSDIDIYVEFKKKNFDNLAGLWVYLEELFQRKVDLVYPRQKPSKILDEIRKKVIYG